MVEHRSPQKVHLSFNIEKYKYLIVNDKKKID